MLLPHCVVVVVAVTPVSLFAAQHALTNKCGAGGGGGAMSRLLFDLFAFTNFAAFIN